MTQSHDSLEAHFHDTVAGGDWLCEQDVVEFFVGQAHEEMVQMEHWGCPWSRKADGHANVRAFGGMKIERTWFAADKTGFHMLHTLFQTSIKYPSIRRFDEHFCMDLVVEDGRVQGVVAIEIATGEFRLIQAKSVIIATGVSYRRLGITELESLAGAGVFYGASTIEAQAVAGKPVFVECTLERWPGSHQVTALPGSFSSAAAINAAGDIAGADAVAEGEGPSAVQAVQARQRRARPTQRLDAETDTRSGGERLQWVAVPGGGFAARVVVTSSGAAGLREARCTDGRRRRDTHRCGP